MCFAAVSKDRPSSQIGVCPELLLNRRGAAGIAGGSLEKRLLRHQWAAGCSH